MKRECDIPEQWKENGSLIYASRIAGRPILNSNDLTGEDIWNIIFDIFKVDKSKIMAI